MTRINITEDGNRTGKWFNQDTAFFFKGKSKWDGNNFISLSTSSQFESEHLYLTKGGCWIKNCDSVYQGGKESYEVISENEAARWLIINEYDEQDDEFKDLPNSVQEILRGRFEELEIS